MLAIRNMFVNCVSFLFVSSQYYIAINGPRFSCRVAAGRNSWLRIGVDNCYITGSDLGCWMLERLSVDDGKKTKISFTAWACPQVATAVVEAFNTVLCVRSLLEQTDVTMQVDNEALYDICRRSLDIDRPTYTNLNRLIASFAPLRRGGARDATN